LLKPSEADCGENRPLAAEARIDRIDGYPRSRSYRFDGCARVASVPKKLPRGIQDQAACSEGLALTMRKPRGTLESVHKSDYSRTTRWS